MVKQKELTLNPQCCQACLPVGKLTINILTYLKAHGFNRGKRINQKNQ